MFGISRAHVMLLTQNCTVSSAKIAGRWRRGWNVEPFHVRSQRCDQQLDARPEVSAVEKPHPAMMFNTQRKSRGAVHGDVFHDIANRTAIDHIDRALVSNYKVRESHRLGFEDRCTTKTASSCSVIVLGEGEGRQFVQIDPDAGWIGQVIEFCSDTRSPTQTIKWDDGRNTAFSQH